MTGFVWLAPLDPECCGWHLLTLPRTWRGHTTYCRCGTLLVLREGTWRRG